MIETKDKVQKKDPIRKAVRDSTRRIFGQEVVDQVEAISKTEEFKYLCNPKAK